MLSPNSYGQITSMALDPIEKKPLARFHPGSMILSVGSYGCNFKCSFCQNHGISWLDPKTVYSRPMPLWKRPFNLLPHGNIGIAYTYNEPAHLL
jgi:pyruvate formate lyase activating enzyme